MCNIMVYYNIYNGIISAFEYLKTTRTMQYILLSSVLLLLLRLAPGEVAWVEYMCTVYKYILLQSWYNVVYN